MEDENIIIRSVNPVTFEYQTYSEEDNTLISSSILDTAFTASTDYIEYYAYDENKNQVYPASNIKAVSLTSFSVEYGDTLLQPDQDLADIGLNYGSYYSTYNFYRRLLGSDITINYYIDEISSDRTEIRLKSTAIDVDTMVTSSNEFISQREEEDYFVDFLLNFGNDTQCIANNIRVDEDDAEPSILIKLYEPLPSQFSLKSSCWVVQEISTSQAYNVEFPIPVFEDNDYAFIQGPNYSIKAVSTTGESGQSFSYNTLIGSNLTSSFNQLENILNRKEVDISVDYTDYNNFIHFSSAKTRLENFFYKVGLIQSSSAAISASYGSITGATSGSVVVSSSVAALTTGIRKIEENFDGYEYFLYYNSGSSVSYPKSTTTPPYILLGTGSAAVQTWISASALSASNFDEQNQNYLYNAIPEYLRSDPNNAKYELFVDMVAQQYDNSWLYTKDISNRFNNDNRLDYGISKDLVADAIKDFGVKLYSNNFNTNDLYTAFLGITPSGSTFPFPDMVGKTPGGIVMTPSGYEYVDTEISASDDIMPLDDVNKRLYKRIYHNIPYLLKRKGTIGGIRALITSYGIPDTILRISEFGGKDKDDTKDWDYNQNEFNYALHLSRNQLNDGNLTFFSSSFVANTAFPSVQTSPQSLQFRFKTGGVPSGSAQITSSLYQNLFVADAGAAAAIAVTLQYNSLGTSPSQSYSGSIAENLKEYGTLTFYPEGSNNVNKTASVTAPFFDGGWWSVQAAVDYDGNQTASLYVANRIAGQIGFSGSGHIAPVDSTYYATATTAYLPTSSVTLNSIGWLPFSGSVQEVRYWDTPLSESLFYDYVVNPYSTQANTINSTPDNLIFRASLGSDLDTGSRKSIHPKVTGSWAITQSFTSDSSFYINQIFTSGSQKSWLNNTEETYLNQVPGGIKNRITDKVRIETTRIPSGSTLSPYRSVQQSYAASGSTPNINYLEVAFSPQNQINDDIIAQIGAFNLGDYIGDPRQVSESINSYPALDQLRDAYFTKYIENYNVNDFVRLIKFFDNSLFRMIEDFTPARTSLSSGVVIKQNLLERNKYAEPTVSDTTQMFPAVASIGQSAIDQKSIVLSGSVLSAPKDYRTGSSDEPQYADSGSAIYTYNGGTAGVFESFNTNFNAPISNSGEPYSGLTAAQVSASAFAYKYPGVIQAFTESVEIELGTNFPVGSGRNNELVSGSGQGTQTVQRIDQREFYNGEFPNVISFKNPEICKTFFGQDAIIDYFFLIQWFNETSFSEENFLSPNNLPAFGNVWFWADIIAENATLKPNSYTNVLGGQQPSGPFVGGVNINPGEYTVVGSTGSGATFNLASAPNSTGNSRIDARVFNNATGSQYLVGDVINIPQATMVAKGFTQVVTDFQFELVASNFLATEGVTNKVKYIKMSNFDINGQTILPFIEDSGYVIFNLTAARDVQGNELTGFQQFYISNFGVQNDQNPNTTDATLLIINAPPSSAAVRSADEAFYDLSFSASGQFAFYGTSSGVDPNVLPDINFTQSIPQGYFPPVAGFPTQSFFKGWASSSYFQADIAGNIFRVSSGSGFYHDPFGYNNFNTGKKEQDFDSLVNEYKPSIIPWFINAQANSYTALSASSLVTATYLTDTASLGLYTSDITASAIQIGPYFEVVPQATPVATSSGQVVISTPITQLPAQVLTAPYQMNFQNVGNPDQYISIDTTDAQVKWTASISYVDGSGWVNLNGGLNTFGTGSNMSPGVSVNVSNGTLSSGNTELRVAYVTITPQGNSSWNSAGDGGPRTTIVEQTFFVPGQGPGGNTPNIPSPGPPQQNA